MIDLRLLVVSFIAISWRSFIVTASLSRASYGSNVLSEQNSDSLLTLKHTVVEKLFEAFPSLSQLEHEFRDDDFEDTLDDFDQVTTEDFMLPEEELLRSSFIPSGLEDGNDFADLYALFNKYNVPSLLSSTISMSLDKFLRDYASSAGNIEQLLKDYMRDSNNNVEVLRDMEDSSSPKSNVNDEIYHGTTKGRGPERNQTGGYEGCRRDYEQLAEPVTTRIFYAVHTAILGFCDSKCNPPRPDNPEICGPLAPCGLIGLLPPPPPNPTRNFTKETIDFIDALGKPQTGITEGKTHWPGSWEFCQSQAVHYTYYNATYYTPGLPVEQREFLGKYCRVKFSLPLRNLPLSLPLAVGICVPDTCSKEDVATYLLRGNLLFWGMQLILPLNISQVYCGQQDFVDFKTDVWAQAALWVSVILGSFVFLSTIYDILFRKKFYTEKYLNLKEDGNKKLGLVERLELAFVGFSAYSNTLAIFGSKRPYVDEIPAIHGIHVLSVFWGYWAIAYVYGPFVSGCWQSANIFAKLLEYPRQAWFQIIINSHYFGDSILFCSGLLITYHWLYKFKDRPPRLRDAVGYIIHSYWKLFPTIAWIVLCYSAFWRYIDRGPFYPGNLRDATNCRENWWVNFLMLHNLVKVKTICMLPTILIPILFQLWIFSIIILVPLSRDSVSGYIFLIFAYVSSVVKAAINSSENYHKPLTGLKDHYLTPWCRAGPYLLGMGLGILLNKYRGKQIKLHWLFIVGGWLISLTLLLSVTFVTYDRFREGGNRWSEGDITAYYTLNRQAWALGIGWIVFACANGFGGAVNSFLSWNVFRTFSKIMLGASVFPLLFIWIYYQMTLIYISHYNMIYIWIGHVWFVLLGGYICALFTQYPLSIGLERAIRCNSKIEALAAGCHWDKDEPAIVAWRQDKAAGRINDKNESLTKQQKKLI